jgi:WD40 repeat protein
MGISLSNTKIFIGYSHADSRYLKELQIHLAPEAKVNVWSDTMIKPGSEWSEEIKQAVASAKVAILLVSADFLASEFISENELLPLLTTAQQEGVTILPVILSPCAFTHTALAQYQAINPPSKPLSSMPKSKRNEVWSRVAMLVKDAQSTQKKSPLAFPIIETKQFIYRGHTYEVRAVAWSPDGKRIASGGTDASVQVWDAATGEKMVTYRSDFHLVRAVAWSPDGKRIASSDDRTVQIWEISTGKHMLTYLNHSDWVLTVAWSPDGRHIASAGVDQTVQIWDANTGEQILTYLGHPSDVRSVAWSPSGKDIVSGGDDQTVQIWDAMTGSRSSSYPTDDDEVYTVAWSPDSASIASAGNNGTVQVRDVVTGVPIFTYRGHTDRVRTVAWSPDSKWIVSGSDDQTVQVWQVIESR